MAAQQTPLHCIATHLCSNKATVDSEASDRIYVGITCKITGNCMHTCMHVATHTPHKHTCIHTQHW